MLFGTAADLSSASSVDPAPPQIAPPDPDSPLERARAQYGTAILAVLLARPTFRAARPKKVLAT